MQYFQALCIIVVLEATRSSLRNLKFSWATECMCMTVNIKLTEICYVYNIG